MRRELRTNIVGLVAFVTAKPRNGKMKLLAILAFVAASFLPALPSAAVTCSPDEINNQSSLSSTSEGGIACPNDR